MFLLFQIILRVCGTYRVFLFNLLIFLKKKKQLLIAGSKYGGITRKHVLAVAVREPFEQQTRRGDTVLIYLRVCTRWQAVSAYDLW